MDKGGKHVNYLSDLTTHFIADNPENPSVEQAFDLYDKVSVTVRVIIKILFLIIIVIFNFPNRVNGLN